MFKARRTQIVSWDSEVAARVTAAMRAFPAWREDDSL